MIIISFFLCFLINPRKGGAKTQGKPIVSEKKKRFFRRPSILGRGPKPKKEVEETAGRRRTLQLIAPINLRADFAVLHNPPPPLLLLLGCDDGGKIENCLRIERLAVSRVSRVA